MTAMTARREWFPTGNSVCADTLLATPAGRAHLDGIEPDTRTMNKTLPLSLLAMIFALAALPGVGRAAPGDGGYASLHVPDLAQAVDFFEHAMNCGLISQSAATDAVQVALLDCGHGNVVEVARAPASRALRAQWHAGATHEAIALVADDPLATAKWLRAEGIALVGQPVMIVHGADAGRILVTLRTPWGQPLRLVSSGVEYPLHGTMAATGLATE